MKRLDLLILGGAIAVVGMTWAISGGGLAVLIAMIGVGLTAKYVRWRFDSPSTALGEPAGDRARHQGSTSHIQLVKGRLDAWWERHPFGSDMVGAVGVALVLGPTGISSDDEFGGPIGNTITWFFIALFVFWGMTAWRKVGRFLRM